MSEVEIERFLTEIPEYNYSSWNVDNLIVEHTELLFIDFFNNYMIKNEPCLIRNMASEWECSQKWVLNDEINYDYISKRYGDLEAPVANCNDIEFNSQCKIDMKVSEYLKYLKDPEEDGKILYLKDWHLKRSQPDDKFYEVPSYFALDWLNEFATDKNEDDFMFVYIGPKGSWTPLHEDVYSSYSWSVNVVGKKKWILFPPGEENKLKDRFGNLPLTFEPEKYEDIKYFEIIQEKGDAIFVPSGWHHQVSNELDTISVNHNWINACNVHLVWKAIQASLLMVEHQIEDLKDTPEFPMECQMILKSVFGMDFETFIVLLCHIAQKRLYQLQGGSKVGLSIYPIGINIIHFDLKQILKVMESINLHPVFIDTNVLLSVEGEFNEIKDAISQIFK